MVKTGPLAVAVPGELQGYWDAHKRYGRLPWSDVIAPTLVICREGYLMTKHQQDSLEINHENVMRDPILR